MNDAPDVTVTLEQWRTLLAVVDQGGYARAAEMLDKSQSAVSYAIQKLETTLKMRVFRLEGRRAVLTPAGELMCQRARLLLDAALATEQAAAEFSDSWQAHITLAVETIFPDSLLFEALTRFSDAYPLTRIEVLETVLSGTAEALFRREARLAITSTLPAGFVGDVLCSINFLAAAAPQHPLHQRKRKLTLADLRRERQLVVRDSGSQRVDAGWLGAEKRWTFSQMATSIEAACAGLGFAWYPELKIRAQLDQGLLKALPLKEGQRRVAPLYLVYTDGDFASPQCRALGDLLKHTCQSVKTPS